MNKFTTIKPTTILSRCYTYRYLSTTQVAGFNKRKTTIEEGLAENTPIWNEANATESEADVKADRMGDTDPNILKKETEQWIKAHKDDLKK